MLWFNRVLCAAAIKYWLPPSPPKGTSESQKLKRIEIRSRLFNW
jgi:hypothetical protein